MFCFLGGSSWASGRTFPEGNVEIHRQAASWSPCILLQMLVMAQDWAEDTSLLPLRAGQTTESCSEKLLIQLTVFTITSPVNVTLSGTQMIWSLKDRSSRTKSTGEQIKASVLGSVCAALSGSGAACGSSGLNASGKEIQIWISADQRTRK